MNSLTTGVSIAIIIGLNFGDVLFRWFPFLNNIAHFMGVQ